MRRLLFIIFLLSLTFPKTVAIEEFELENKSEIYSFTGTIYLTCANRTVDVFLYDEKPIDNATVFLMYEYGVLNNAVTDSEGKAHLWFTGNYQFMTKLFQIRIDKPTYRKMLISFNVDECKQGEEGFYIMHEVETFVPPTVEESESDSEEKKENVTETKPAEREPPVKIVKQEEQKPEEKACAPAGIFALLVFMGMVGWLRE
ncbi:MAG: hypothetical protein QXY61_04795 [Candidatus Anstonellales archaeon]